MARIIVSKCEKKEKSIIKQSYVTATYSVNTEEGLFQIDTYGKSTRKNPNKISQTFQIDKESAQQLIALLEKELFLQKSNVAFTQDFYNQSNFSLSKNKLISYSQDFPLQQIFYGAPGTGKSHTINEQTKGESVIRTTFHPDSDYSTFVGAYKPTTKSVELRDVSGHKIIEDGKEVKEDRIVYEFVAQAFLQAYILAWKSYSQPTDEGVVKPQYLVIEEINRGNCAQIFGDIFQLLDRDDNGFSKYEITSDADLHKYIADQNLAVSGVCDSHGKDISDKINSGEFLKLPNNFYIWATMNTSDQSLFPIDSAFKRRWDWKYVPIDINKENWTIKTATKEYSWSSFLQKINDEIDDTTHSEDKMLGFYFCKADDGVISSEKFVGKVLFYVYNDVFKDYGFSREMFKGDDGKIIFFHSYYNSDGSIDENKVEKFLDNLEVDGVDDVDSNDAPQESEDVVGDKLTETQQLRKAYWEAFLKFANNSSEEYRKYFNRRRTPSTDKWFNFSIGSKDCHLVVEQTRSRNELATGLYIPKSMALFYKLRENKENIENEIGYPFDWKELPEKKASYIVATINDIDFEANDRESSQFDVIIKRLLRMREVFKKYIDL